jgi:hypothetical protein
MKSNSELTDFYYETLYPTLQELEEQRKAVASKATRLFAGIGIAALIIIVALYNYFNMFNSFMLIIVILALGAAQMTYRFVIQDYRSDFKFRVIAPLIKEIDEQLSYSPTAKISQQLFERSRLFQSKIDRFRGNDLVQGVIDNVNLQFSDLHVESISKDSKGKSHHETIFKGLYIVSEFNKHFKSRTIILPDSAEKVFGALVGKWLQSKNFSRDDLITLDDMAFEKEFVVYGNDQIESRYLLTHSMMERLLNFKKRVGHPIAVSFIDTHIHIAIKSDQDLFEPSVFASLLDYKSAMSYINALQYSIGIIEELKLNERLWSKT